MEAGAERPARDAAGTAPASPASCDCDPLGEIAAVAVGTTWITRADRLRAHEAVGEDDLGRRGRRGARTARARPRRIRRGVARRRGQQNVGGVATTRKREPGRHRRRGGSRPRAAGLRRPTAARSTALRTCPRSSRAARRPARRDRAPRRRAGRDRPLAGGTRSTRRGARRRSDGPASGRAAACVRARGQTWRSSQSTSLAAPTLAWLRPLEAVRRGRRVANRARDAWSSLRPALPPPSATSGTSSAMTAAATTLRVRKDMA